MGKKKKSFKDRGGEEHKNLHTAIIAPPGSGKTTMFQQRGILIAVPRLSQATIKTGASTSEIIELTLKKEQYITHQKLSSHLEGGAFLMQLAKARIRIVVDEAHAIFTSIKLINLYALAFQVKVPVVYSSGTMYEGLLPNTVDSYKFQDKQGEPVIYFSDTMPITGDANVLYFMENAKYVHRIADKGCAYLSKAKYKGMDNHKKNKNGDYIIQGSRAGATSSMREGVNMKFKKKLRDKRTFVIIYKPYSPLSSLYEDIQSLERLRKFEGDNIIRVIVGHSKYIGGGIKEVNKRSDYGNHKELFKIKVDNIDKLRDKLQMEAIGLGEWVANNLIGPKNYVGVSEFGDKVNFMTRIASNSMPDLYIGKDYEGECRDEAGEVAFREALADPEDKDDSSCWPELIDEVEAEDGYTEIEMTNCTGYEDMVMVVPNKPKYARTRAKGHVKFLSNAHIGTGKWRNMDSMERELEKVGGDIGRLATVSGLINGNKKKTLEQWLAYFEMHFTLEYKDDSGDYVWDKPRGWGGNHIKVMAKHPYRLKLLGFK